MSDAQKWRLKPSVTSSNSHVTAIQRRGDGPNWETTLTHGRTHKHAQALVDWHNADIDELKAENERLKEALQYKPIKDAPLDGTPVILCNKRNEIGLSPVGEASFVEGEGWWWANTRGQHWAEVIPENELWLFQHMPRAALEGEDK